MRVFPFVILVLAAVFPVPSAWGQNPVSNSHFDTDVAGWTAGFDSTIEWNSFDANGSPTSGSALVTNLSTSALNSDGARQCLDGLTGGAVYRVAADVLVPGGQSETGNAELLVQWYPEPACSGGMIELALTPGVTTGTPDLWYRDWMLVGAPSGTQSARLRLSILKAGASGTLDAHFDNIEFAEQVFGDGFEDGTTDAWSSAVP